MKWRSIVVVLVVVASVLMAPIAMAYAGCPMMGTVCYGPCGVSCAAVSPVASLSPAPSAVASIVPEVHHHRNVFAAFEPPPKITLPLGVASKRR
jgi:hypothetical protein